MKRAIVFSCAATVLAFAGANISPSSADELRLDPARKLARWQSGQVLHNGEWHSLEDIEAMVSRDPRWQEYKQRVEDSTDTFDAHVEVARWCRSQKMDLEARWHWINVLRHDPKNKEALGSLGLRPYQGGYLTTEEIEQTEARQKQAKADFKRYSGILKTALREAEQSDGTDRVAALKKISSIDDVAAVPAIIAVVLADVKNEQRILSKLGTVKGEVLLRQMQLSAIAAFSGMSEHEATLRLLEAALYASDEAIRIEAARSLKGREPTSFMPLLMAGLAAPIEVSFVVNTLPNGQITVFEDFSEAGPLMNKKHTRASTFLTQHVSTHTHDTTTRADRFTYGDTYRSTRIARVWSERWRDMANAKAQVTNTQDRVALENAMREERNSRIKEVVDLAWSKESGESPEELWADWKDYNEVYTSEELPVNETEENYDYSQRYEQYTYGRTLPKLEQRPIRTRSCFVAGTPVWTQAGPMAIEKIKVGELVLSQNPHTGELNYRPVIDTTVRPPSGTVKLGLNGETIVTTRGHRFWVAGKGWEMAKLLDSGKSVVAIGGSTAIQSAETGSEEIAYNLEVGGFHTYFVGENRILVHDNTCPEPTINVVPGVSPKSKAAAQMALRH